MRKYALYFLLLISLALHQGRINCDIGFLLDASGSINKRDYETQKKFVELVAKEIGIARDGVHFGVITFSQQASLDIKLNDFYSFDTFHRAVQSLKQEGSITRIDLALKKAHRKLFSVKNGHRPNANKRVYLLTDGVQSKTIDSNNPSYEAMSMRYLGVSLFVIGIGSKVNVSDLEQIAGTPDQVYHPQSYDELINSHHLKELRAVCNGK